MTFKNLYFALLFFLTGLLASVYLASERIDRESYGSPSFDKQVVVSTPEGESRKEGYTFQYSKNIQRRMTLPIFVSVSVGIAFVLGIATIRNETNKEPNKSPEPTR